MKLQQLGLASVGLGVVLLVASLLWTSIVSDQAVWSEEQALEYQEVAAKLHDDSFNLDLSKAKLAESQANFDAMDEQLNRARAVKNSTPFYLRMTGIATCLIGVSLVLVARSRQQ